MKIDEGLKRGYYSPMSKIKKLRHNIYVPQPLHKRATHIADLGIATINAMAIEGLYLIVAKKEEQHKLKVVGK